MRTSGDKIRAADNLRQVPFKIGKVGWDAYYSILRVVGSKETKTLIDDLADLIDPQEPEEAEVKKLREEMAAIKVWECEECGERFEEAYGLYEFCPNCRTKLNREKYI